MKQSKLSDKIEILEIDEMDGEQIARVVAAFSTEGINLRRARKAVRYHLYRLQTEANGGTAADVTDDFRAIFEADPNFGGWRFFGINWDVSMDDPYRCVNRVKSVTQEWDELVMAKFPTVEPGGKVTYPDINVRKKVEANARKQKKKKRK